jgi:hypothetical protein
MPSRERIKEVKAGVKTSWLFVCYIISLKIFVFPCFCGPEYKGILHGAEVCEEI